MDQTAAAPPIRGSTILANIGWTANSNSAERNSAAGYNAGAKRAVRADVGRKSISLSRFMALFLADTVWGKRCQSCRSKLVTAGIEKAAYHSTRRHSTRRASVRSFCDAGN